MRCYLSSSARPRLLSQYIKFWSARQASKYFIIHIIAHIIPSQKRKTSSMENQFSLNIQNTQKLESNWKLWFLLLEDDSQQWIVPRYEFVLVIDFLWARVWFRKSNLENLSVFGLPDFLFVWCSFGWLSECMRLTSNWWYWVENSFWKKLCRIFSFQIVLKNGKMLHWSIFQNFTAKAWMLILLF